MKNVLRIKKHYKEILIHKERCGHIRKHLKKQEFPSIRKGVKILRIKIECDNWEVNYGIWGRNYYYSDSITEKQVKTILNELDKYTEYRGYTIRHCESCFSLFDEIVFPSFENLEFCPMIILFRPVCIKEK